MYIHIVIFFVIAVIIAILLSLIIYYSGGTKSPSVQSVNATHSILTIGSNPDEFIVPALWQIHNQNFPLDPCDITQGDKCVGIDDPNPCKFFNFTSVDNFYPPSYKLSTIFDTGGCDGSKIGDVTCESFPINNFQTCFWPDQLYAMFGSQTCFAPPLPNAGNKCTRQDGTTALVGDKDCFYTSCLSSGGTSSSGLKACSSPLEMIMFNYQPEYFFKNSQDLTQNPLFAMACLQVSYLVDPSTSEGRFIFTSEVCDVRKTTYKLTSTCGQSSSELCQSQFWVVTSYTITPTGELSQSDTGNLISIYDRNSGLYLAPAGFNPLSKTPYKIGEELLNPPTYDSADADLTLLGDISDNPGVWWMNVDTISTGLGCTQPGSDNTPNALGRVNCGSPPQIIFTSGWKYVAPIINNQSKLLSFIISSPSMMWKYTNDPAEPTETGVNGFINNLSYDRDKWPNSPPVNLLGKTANGYPESSQPFPVKVVLRNFVINYEGYQPSICVDPWVSGSPYSSIPISQCGDTSSESTTQRCCANNLNVGMLDYTLYNAYVNQKHAS